MSLSVHEIERLARDRFGEPNRGLSSRREMRFGRKGSVKVEMDGPKAGAWYDYEAASGGWLDGAMPEGYERQPSKPGTERAESAEKFESVRRGSVSLDGTPGETYLRSRGIDRWPGHCVRWSPERHGILFLAAGADGYFKAGQIVYLTADGAKQHRADGVQKRTLASVRRWHEIAAMRLPGAGEPVLCEGPETALSIWVAHDCRRAVFACLGRAGLGALRVRNRRIVIARDGDDPGSTADLSLTRAIADRSAIGQRVRVTDTPLGADFNDVLLRQGSAEVRRLIREAQS